MGLRAALTALGVRFERSALGECLISVLVCVVVLIATVWNLPDSYLKRSLVKALLPVAESTGLQQQWSMYAPDPISVLEELEVRVTMAGGNDRTWTSRRDDPALTAFTWYRWQKLKEQLIRDKDAVPAFAQWVVHELAAPGERPVHVAVLVRSRPLLPPGDDRPTDVTVRTLYRSDVRTA
ncbi:hypothetical protein PDG61_17080 [Mycolicibacterium sp. BiH015]|uniref:hypothetical protein n=1 Tax=Mycolicibacterium sp. BiH015 TaxID=3018808 RepID=UPI0022E76908|nr:hypothetical protein [Mycolicibacterium sp. BiH015]MDA2892637.1 hypothetical protein [Mycolicibacterium sp. BiH015]